MWMDNLITKVTATFQRSPPLNEQSLNPRQGIGASIVPYDSRPDVTRRVLFVDRDTTVFGWPSRGGVVILKNATALDFDFLGLDHLYPAEKRFEDRDTEDGFCKQLLLLGAKWWDLVARFSFLEAAESDEANPDDFFERCDEPKPTAKEKTWIGVAWPSSGRFVVSEYNTTIYGFDSDADDLVPDDVARLGPCRNMDEKAAMLKERFQGQFYDDMKEYLGYSFIDCWDSKKTGEHGPLQKTWSEC